MKTNQVNNGYKATDQDFDKFKKSPGSDVPGRNDKIQKNQREGNQSTDRNSTNNDQGQRRHIPSEGQRR